MFTRLNWPFAYEAIDLSTGRIPDFVLLFKHPTLVECKPVVSLEDMRVEQTNIQSYAREWLAEDYKARLRALDVDPTSSLFDVDVMITALENVERDRSPMIPGRRALVAGARLFVDRYDVVTLDGEREFRVCPPGDHVGLFEVHRGHGTVDLCLVCGNDDHRNQSVCIPSSQLHALWKQAGNETRWKPRSVGEVFRHRPRD